MKKQILKKDKDFLWHPFTQSKGSENPIVVDSAKDEVIFDVDGKKYIDLGLYSGTTKVSAEPE